ncbi:hypothetical protein [Methylobacterium sp. sgz302541]|uniref:hypothetical protein n=1 Tax=unclassified Methylobacterium TaxID=2615210 RepID=UPI003D327108
MKAVLVPEPVLPGLKAPAMLGVRPGDAAGYETSLKAARNIHGKYLRVSMLRHIAVPNNDHVHIDILAIVPDRSIMTNRETLHNLFVPETTLGMLMGVVGDPKDWMHRYRAIGVGSAAGRKGHRPVARSVFDGAPMEIRGTLRRPGDTQSSICRAALSAR